MMTCGLVSVRFELRVPSRQFPCTKPPDHRPRVHTHIDAAGVCRARWVTPAVQDAIPPLAVTR